MYRIYKVNDNPVVDYAAEELKKYLRMMMPDAGEIIIERKLDATEGFRLGLMADFGLDTSPRRNPSVAWRFLSMMISPASGIIIRRYFLSSSAA